MSPTQRTSSSVRRFRRILLFGFIAFVGTLVALYLFGRQSTTDLPPRVSDGEAPAGAVIAIGRDFHYEVTEEGRKLWEIDADRLISDDQGRYVLEGVAMSGVREGGSSYSIQADRGVYALEKNEATLTGNVVLTGSRGLTMKTDGLQLIRKGRIVVSSAPVAFTFGEVYRGRANKFEVHFPRDRITLAGRVEVSTLPEAHPSASLTGRRVVFFRQTHNLVAEGSPVTVRHGEDSLEARRLSLNFDENDDQLLFALASWSVRATARRLEHDGIPASATVSGDTLSVIFDEQSGDPERFEMDAPAGGRARLTSTDATGLLRTMDADYLWADFRNGRLHTAQGLGGVAIEERLRHADGVLVRQICSETAEAQYDAAGEIAAMSLVDSVSYLEPDLQVGGGRLAAEGDSGPVTLTGSPAWIVNAQGRLEAPRILLDRESRTVRALEGVRAEMVDESNTDLAAGESEEPVRVQAGEATWTDDPRNFEFEGDVRAWQGENFLVSQTLGLEGDDLLASGNVRSVWHKRSPRSAPVADADNPDSDTETPAPPAAEDEPPVQISSTTMRFERELGRLTYEGSARVVQGARSMACPRLQVQLGDDEEFERFYCEAGTTIDDGVAGNRLAGDAAIFHNAASKVKVIGDPARLNQADGGSITARTMVYDFDTAIAEIDSVADDEAELFLAADEYWAEKRAAAAPAEGDDAPAAAAGEGDLPGTPSGSGVAPPAAGREGREGDAAPVEPPTIEPAEPASDGESDADAGDPPGGRAS